MDFLLRKIIFTKVLLIFYLFFKYLQNCFLCFPEFTVATSRSISLVKANYWKTNAFLKTKQITTELFQISHL